MSQTLQNQILLAKSMNGIVTLSDGAGTTITNGTINTSNVNTNNMTANNLTLSALDLNSSLTLEEYDNIDIPALVDYMSLWEKGHSYFEYLPQSLATPTQDTELITRLFANNNYGRLTISNTWSATNNFTGGISVGGVPTAVTYTTGGSNSNFNTDSQPFQFIDPTGYYNMAYGTNALKSITTGDGNAAFGYGTLQNLTTGGSNVAFGNLSLTNCTTGILNLAFGYNAGGVMVSSLATSCIGYNAGNSGFQGNYVNLFGINSYIASSGLSYSTCLGTGSFIDANNQVALGTSADTIIIRGNTGLANTDSTNKIASTAFCQSAINRLLYQDSLGNFGFNTTHYTNAPPAGGGNFAIGNNALQKLTTGGYNTAVGNVSLRDCTTGSENFCLGALSMYALTTGSFNVAVGVFCLPNTNGSGNVGIGRYVAGGSSGDNNVYIGYFAANSVGADGNNVGIGGYVYPNIGAATNNVAVGGSAGAGLTTGTNNTFLGTSSSLSSGTLTYATAIGAGSQATTSNSIYLGRGTDITYFVGGANLPTGKVLTLVGNIFANSTTITPAQLSVLSTISGSIVDTGTIQTITARKNFDGFDNTAPNYCGSSFVSPVMRPRLFSLANSISYSCHAFGSNAGKNLLADGTNTGCYVLGQDNLSTKTTACFNVCSIGGGNMSTFVAESFSFVTTFGQGHLSNENGYSLSNVTMIGANTTFLNGTIKPTSVTNALFNSAYGISLSASTAISNVFAIRTAQPITKSNMGIIGDSTEITLHSTGQKVIITGGLELQNQLKSSIASPQLNYTSANFTLTAPFKQYYHLILNAGATITLPVADATMVGQEFTIKRRGGTAGVVSLVQQNFQPIFTTGGAGLGTTGSLLSFISATQSTAKLMCIQSHFAGSGFATLTAGATTLQIVNSWNTLPSSFITIGTRLTIAGVTRYVTAFAGGTGGLGNYTVDSAYSASAITQQPITSTDQFGWDILYVQ